MMDFIRNTSTRNDTFWHCFYSQEDKKREAADIIAKNGRPLSQASDDEPGPNVAVTIHQQFNSWTPQFRFVFTYNIHESREIL